MGRYVLAVMLMLAASLLTAHAGETVYFPKGAENWYPKHLAAMKEPSLFEQSTKKLVQQYRFLWLRTFHKPIAVRIRKDSEGITLRVVRLSGAGSYFEHKIGPCKSTTCNARQSKSK